MIPYSTQSIDDTDIEAVREILESPFLTTGPTINEFENAVAEYTKCEYAIAVNSCTSALHLAMMAIGVSPSDRVFVSAISFAASANCARFMGAEVDFVDVSPKSGNMDLDVLEEMLRLAEQENRLPKAVVAVHLSGRPLDLIRLDSLRAKYGFKLVEDAAHAIGALFHGEYIGSCRHSDITVFSFHPVKIITTAEGGMCLTNNPEYAHAIRMLSSHGITHDIEDLCNTSKPAYYYEMQRLGYNYRMTDIQAALGISQLARIEDFLEKRRSLARSYQELFSDFDKIGLPQADTPDNVSSWHLYQVRIPGNFRDSIFKTLRQKGIGVQVHYLPIYRHPYYQSLKDYPMLPGAEEFFEHTLSIPLYPNLSRLNQQMVAATLMSALDQLL